MSKEVTKITAETRSTLREHESGRPMIFLRPFRPSSSSQREIADLVANEVAQNNTARFVRIHLDEDQGELRTVLRDLGFSCDGTEYRIELKKLKTQLRAERLKLPRQLTVRPMTFEQDIENVTALERRIHAADLTSRVSFEDEVAIQGLKNYYQGRCKSRAAFTLRNDLEEIVGVIAFMPDKHQSGAVHVSSVGLDTRVQGQGLFFAFLLKGLELSEFSEFSALTGTTTTDRLVLAADRYGAKIVGWSWIKTIKTAPAV